MRMTKQRQAMLQLLQHETAPRTAEMLWQQLPEGTMDRATAYRTFDALFRHGWVSKSFCENATYYYWLRDTHHHFMLCLGCHQMVEIDCLLDDAIHTLAAQNEFTITHHDMTVYGYCKTCQSLRQTNHP